MANQQYKAVFLSFPFVLLTFICFSQKKFVVKNGSKIYDAVIAVANCEEGTCSGKGTVTLTRKSDKSVLQVLKSDDLYFDVDSASGPSVNTVELYGEQSPLIFDDFNFDGSEDLAIRNGNNGGYGGPSYDVYVFNITSKKFVLSKKLTELVTENLGMFQVDKKRQRLITYSKSGCCWHLTSEYAVIPGKGLQKVAETEEDATQGDGETVIVTHRTFVNNKWVEKVKKYKTKDYYN